MGSYHQLVEAATVAESNKRAPGYPGVIYLSAKHARDLSKNGFSFMLYDIGFY